MFPNVKCTNSSHFPPPVVFLCAPLRKCADFKGNPPPTVPPLCFPKETARVCKNSPSGGFPLHPTFSKIFVYVCVNPPPLAVCLCIPPLGIIQMSKFPRLRRVSFVFPPLRKCQTVKDFPPPAVFLYIPPFGKCQTVKTLCTSPAGSAVHKVPTLCTGGIIVEPIS